MRSFKVEVHGHIYQGTWLLLPEGQVEVRSDYGKVRAQLGVHPPEDVARSLLSRMIPGPDAKYWSKRSGLY